MYSTSIKSNFKLVFDKDKSKIEIEKLLLNDEVISIGWQQVTELVATFESSLRNNLRNHKVEFHDYEISGEVQDGAYTVLIKKDSNVIVKYNSVEVQQLVSILNKFLHMADKLIDSRSYVCDFLGD